MPDSFDPAKERSMVVVLHGAGGTETGMAGSLAFLAAEDYVVVAPKSAGQTWEKADLDAVKRIVAMLRKSLRIGKDRLHGLGFSNGGWNLHSVAFDPDLRFTSACWVAAGYKEGKPPPHAAKGMGVLAMAGEKDPNRPFAEATVDLLEGKVRSVEFRMEPGAKHEWTPRQMPYYGWWLGVQEGRFTPGSTRSLDWLEPTGDPQGAMAAKKLGGFVYWYSSEDDGVNEKAKQFENATLQDPLVRFLGNQLVAWKQDRKDFPANFLGAGLKSTPAVVVYQPLGTVVKVLEGDIKPAALAAALRAVAKEKSPPKRK